MLRGMKKNSKHCISGKLKVSVEIRNQMEMEDKQLQLGSRRLPGQSNWENDAKERKFHVGTELSEHVGETCLTSARTVSRLMLLVSRTSPST